MTSRIAKERVVENEFATPYYRLRRAFSFFGIRPAARFAG